MTDNAGSGAVASEHQVIWLQPNCVSDSAEDRLWCQDDVWGNCEECGTPSVKYVIATELDAAQARIRELEQIAEQSRAAMLRTRTASIAGCEEGYGKPEKWANELFVSHGDLTKAIKAIDAALTSSAPEESQ